MKDVFISHSSKDIEYAKELYKKLEQDEQLEQIYTQMGEQEKAAISRKYLRMYS